METRRSCRGFTLHELFIVIQMIFSLGALTVGFFGLPMANIWVTKDGVLGAAKVFNPKSREVLMIRRGMVDFSVITVKNSDGSCTSYEVDSNIFFNYKLREISTTPSPTAVFP